MDRRWVQRFDNYCRALNNLEAGLGLGSWNAFEKQGVVKAFELCYELAWKTLQDLLAERELSTDPTGPRAVLRSAFEAGLIADSDPWSRLHEARNRAAHIYDAEKADLLFEEIRSEFFPLLRSLGQKLEALR